MKFQGSVGTLRRRAVVVLSALTGALVLAGIPATTASAASNCKVTWGSLLKSSPEMSDGHLVGARIGRHECFDRLVIDLDGSPAPGYFVRYTDGLHQPGSGDPLAVSGGAVLTITPLAPGYDDNFQATVPWRVGDHIARPTSFKTFRDLVYAGSFEGESTLGLGVRARLPFRVMKLDGPGGGSRLVIDVAHRW